MPAIANPTEPGVDVKPLRFVCRNTECGYTFAISRDEDPTSSSGCCKTCGTKNWVIIDRITREILG